MRRQILMLLALALLAGCGPQQSAQTGTPGASASPAAADTPAATALPAPSAALAATAPAPATAAPEATAPAAPTGETAPSGAASVVYRVPGDGSLRAVAIGGGAEIVLGDPTEPGQRLPWSASPDGRTVALITGGGWSGKQGLPLRASLWVVGVDGSDPRRLLDLAGATPPGAGFGGDWAALTGEQLQRLAWTPDGRAVVVASAHEGQVDLYAVEAATGAARRLTATPALEFGASVAPDGRALAYGSASSFGTGAGWADVGAWLLPLEGGEPRPALLPVAGAEPPAALSIAGWLGGGTLIVQATSMGVTSSTIWATEGDASPRPLYSAPGRPALDLQGDTLLFADQAPGQEGSLWSWRAGEAVPQQRAPLGLADALYASPSGEAALVCAGGRGQEGGPLLWSQGRIASVSGGCGRPAWSDDGRVALPADPAGGANGLVVGLADGVELGLGPAALPAGWLGGTLFFFGPRGAAGAEWQLLSSDSAGIRPLAPVGGAPEGPLLVVRAP